MNDYIAYLAAQDRTADAAREARPDRPTHPDRQGHELRLKVSMALHRLADRLEPSSPAPAGHPPGAPAPMSR